MVCQVNSWVPVLAAQHMRSEKINWIGDSSLLAYCQGLPLQLLRTGWRRRGDVVLNYGISFKMHCIYSAPFLFVAPVIRRNSCAWNVICDRGDLRVFFLVVFHRRGGLNGTFCIRWAKEAVTAAVGSLARVEKYHLETEYSIPPAPITPSACRSN